MSLSTPEVSLTYDELIESLVKWAETNNHDWHVGWEDEGIVSINFEYVLTEEDDNNE